MILIHYILIIAVSSTTAYPQRRNHNIRRTKLHNSYNITPIPFTARTSDEEKYRSSKQYVPVHRLHKHKNPEITSRADHFMSTADVDEIVKKYTNNRTIRNNLKKYVTTDEIRPTRLQYSTTTNVKKNNNKPSHYEKPDNFEQYNKQTKITQYENQLTPQKNEIPVNNYDSLYQRPNNEVTPSNNYHESLTTPRPREENIYSTFSVDQYLSNPFLASVLKKPPTTAFLPPIEVTSSPIQYLPPIEPTSIFSPSPEIVNHNYQPMLIPPNIEQPINFQTNSPFNDDIIYDPNVNMDQMEELGIATGEVIQRDVHLLPQNNKPIENVFLPPRFASEIHTIEEKANNFYKDQSNVMDTFQQEAMREMSFESVKINGSPSSTPKPIKKISPSPRIEIISPTIQEVYTIQPIGNERIHVDQNKPQVVTDTNYPPQRRNDHTVYFQQDSYQKRPIKEINREKFYTQSTNHDSTNPNDRSSRDQSWLSNEELISDQSRSLHLKQALKHIDQEYTASLQTMPYGTKIDQPQYLFAAERSNGPQATFEGSVNIPDKSFESTTANYESMNVHNVRQPQEFVSPTSSVRHTQEFSHFRQPEENVIPNQNPEYNITPTNVMTPQEITKVANTKTSQEYFSSSIPSYPKEFTKALQTYVNKQNEKQKQEKPVEKKLRQPKDYPRDLVQRSEQASFLNSNELFQQYGDQFTDPQHDLYTQSYNHTNNNIRPTTESIPVLRQTKEMAVDGSFHYETLIGDQTHVIQEGHIENPGTEDEEQVIHGSYSFLGDDGKTYTVNYVADGNGFRAAGDHLPTPPPIPEIIQRSIEKNLIEAEKNPDFSEENFKHNSNFNDLNGIRDRSLGSKPIFTNNYKDLNSERSNLRNSNYNRQPNFPQAIQPRKDSSRPTDLYSNSNSEGNIQTKNSMKNYVIQRRSDQGYGEVFIEKPDIVILNEQSNVSNDKHDVQNIPNREADKDPNNNMSTHNNVEIQRRSNQETNNYDTNQYNNENMAGNNNNANNYDNMDYIIANSDQKPIEVTTAISFTNYNNQMYDPKYDNFNSNKNPSTQNIYNGNEYDSAIKKYNPNQQEHTFNPHDVNYNPNQQEHTVNPHVINHNHQEHTDNPHVESYNPNQQEHTVNPHVINYNPYQQEHTINPHVTNFNRT